MASTSPTDIASGHWSDFWRHGSLTTFFAGKYQHGYDGPVAEFWADVFDSLPLSATLVDLATGNGAIPYLAAQAADRRQAQWRIIGVDYADIQVPTDPAVRAQMSQVELLPNTRMEQTGLDGDSVDLVTSHFGFEYGDVEQVVAEVDRLLKPAGTLALVMHHPDSAVVRQAKRDYQQTRMCLDQERLDRKVTRLVKLVGHARTPYQRDQLRHNPDAEKLRHQINRSMERLLQKVRGQEDDSQMFRVAQSFLRVFADLIDRPLEEKLDFIRQSSASLSAYAGRMESMARATMSQDQFDQFLGLLEGIGLKCEQSGLLQTADGELIGRSLVAFRP